MRVCPVCGTRYDDQAVFCPMDGSPLGGVREAEPNSEAPSDRPAEPVAAAPKAPWAGFGSWPASLGPPPDKPLENEGAPRFFAPPPSKNPVPVAVDPIRESRVETPPSIKVEPAPTREATMRWQPSTSGAASAAASAVVDPAPEPPAGWERPAWLSVAPQEEEDPEEDLRGVVLGDRYRVDERIGSGGMGVVHRATHVVIGKQVAIKVLRRRFARQSDIAQRFAQEARIASSIKHPNVVDISDFGTTPGGSPFCVMEHLDGHSLSQELDRIGQLEPAFALDVALQVARGLAAAHHAGVVHRDLKPDNVFLVRAESQAGRSAAVAKILDFGIARVASNKARLTAAGAVIGTPEYMSPEQARGDEVDGRSDLYALGVMLFETLTGRVPLQGTSLAGTLTKQVFEAPPRLREIDPRFAALPSIEAVVGRLLAKPREDRPPDAVTTVRLLQTAAANDLGEPEPDPRSRAALEGWGEGGRETGRSRRSTMMIGSDAITSAHEAVRPFGSPATGDFDARPAAEPGQGKRPSVIVRDGAVRARPERLVGQTRSDLMGMVGPPPSSPNVTPRTPTPTPEPSDAVRRRKQRLARRQNLPIILLAAGAAIFAALATIGFVQWWQHRGDTSTDSSRE